ncbi:transposase, partial [Bacillus thuringiensis]|uniref:transposase n=1 Tax=Bacillus thuringiensis TaxID=1428 RepID=UPI003D6D5A09
MFIGYFCSIPSHPQFQKHIKTNIPYPSFLPFSLSPTIPHHSTITSTPPTPFIHTNIFQQIFHHILTQPTHHPILPPPPLITHSTHINPNPN